MFENPYLLIAVLVVVEMVLLRVWSRWRTPGTKWIAIGGLIAMPVLVTVQALVDTDSEQLRRVCREMVDAVERGDIEVVATHLSDRFRLEDGNRVWEKSAVVDRIRSALSARWDVQEERLSAFEIAFEGGQATVAFRATCRLVTSEKVIPRHVSLWRLTMAKEEGIWRVTDAEPIRTRWVPFDSLADLLP